MTTICPTCGHESEQSWRCEACGKPFEGDEPDDDRSALGGGA